MLRLNRNITDELNYEVPDEMDINDLYELYQQAKPIADDDFTIDVQNNIYVFLPMTEDRAYLKKEEVNFDSENYVDFLRKCRNCININHPMRPMHLRILKAFPERVSC